MAGSRFVRADLHVHTTLGPGEAAPASAPSVAAALQAARDAGLSIIGIADHNSIVNVNAALAGAGPDLLVLPGVELSTAEGHLVGLFPPTGVDQLERLMQPDVVRLREIDASEFTTSDADAVRRQLWAERQSRLGLKAMRVRRASA